MCWSVYCAELDISVMLVFEDVFKAIFFKSMKQIL